jgi:hypothetical protein
MEYYLNSENISNLLSSSYYKQLELSVINPENSINSNNNRGKMDNLRVHELCLCVMNFLSLIMTGYDRYSSDLTGLRSHEDLKKYEDTVLSYANIINELATNLWFKNVEEEENKMLVTDIFESYSLFASSLDHFDEIKKQINSKIFNSITCSANNAYNYNQKKSVKVSSTNDYPLQVANEEELVQPIEELIEPILVADDESVGNNIKKRVRNNNNSNNSNSLGKSRKKLRSLQISLKY